MNIIKLTLKFGLHLAKLIASILKFIAGVITSINIILNAWKKWSPQETEQPA